MPLRLVEVRLPEVPSDSESAIGDVQVVDHWITAMDDGTASLRVLVDTTRTEALADHLRDAYSESNLRIVVLAVEATIPKVDEEEPPENDPHDLATPGRISREELHQDVEQATRLTPVYVAMVFLSTVVAAVGLIRGDVAIIIGAMVIAPLLGPNMGLSLAATLGDPPLARTALRTIAVGVFTAGITSVLIGVVMRVDPTVPDIAARTQAGFGDIALGLAAGAAGTLAFTGGLPGTVVGVMVAVALLPPLVVSGLLVGAGELEGAMGALLLVGVNISCINLAAVATFLIQKVRPRSWWEEDRAKKAVRIAMASWLVLLLGLAALIVFGDVGLDVG